MLWAYPAPAGGPGAEGVLGVNPYYDQGGITIYHGDCREILPTFAPASVEMIFTDPPYGIVFNNNNDLAHRWEAALGRTSCGPPRPISGDDPEAWPLLMRWSVAEWRRLLKSNGVCCCCGGGGGPSPRFAWLALWLDEVMRFKQMVIWEKPGLGLGWHYRRCYEVVLVAEKGHGQWTSTRKDVSNIVRFCKHIPTDEEHPTLKPVALATCFIELHSRQADLILDPFAGSGTTLVAAKLLGRRAIGIEVEERWCEIGAQRLAQGALPL